MKVDLAGFVMQFLAFLLALIIYYEWLAEEI
jgi:hypothetical protein